MANEIPNDDAVYVRLGVKDDKMSLDIINTFTDTNSKDSQMFTTLAFGLIEAAKLDIEYLLELGAKQLFKEMQERQSNGDAPCDT